MKNRVPSTSKIPSTTKSLLLGRKTNGNDFSHLVHYSYSVSVKITLENHGKEKMWNKRHFYMKLHLEDCFGKELITL